MKLDNIINGDMQPPTAYHQASSPQPRRENSPEGAVGPRNASFERNRPSLHTESQDTLFQDESSRERHSLKSNHNCKHATLSFCVAGGVGELNQALVNAFLKPKAEVDIFDGDVLAFNRFLRQVEASAIAYCSSDKEKLTLLEKQVTHTLLRSVFRVLCFCYAKGCPG